MLIEAHDLDMLVAQVERGEGNVVVTIPPDLPVLTARVVRAAIEGLAIACAPHRRINAVAPAAQADPGDVAAAVRFLAAAPSTTGQILVVSARNGQAGG